jgi:RNA polymerase sigma-70 factor, ECF subfamily
MPDQSAVAAAVLEGGSPAQVQLLQRLRAGDHSAFGELVDTWSPMLLRVALLHVSTRASAEEVVQDTWLAVIEHLERFEGRSSLRTWVFRILENQARSRGVRDARTLPWSSAFRGDDTEDAGPTVDPTRFRGPGDRWPGGWTPAGRPATR